MQPTEALCTFLATGEAQIYAPRIPNDQGHDRLLQEAIFPEKIIPASILPLRLDGYKYQRRKGLSYNIDPDVRFYFDDGAARSGEISRLDVTLWAHMVFTSDVNVETGLVVIEV